MKRIVAKLTAGDEATAIELCTNSSVVLNPQGYTQVSLWGDAAYPGTYSTDFISYVLHDKVQLLQSFKAKKSNPLLKKYKVLDHSTFLNVEIVCVSGKGGSQCHYSSTNLS